ncbi:MAG TPA: lytic transglycosylase domain-containing protein [Candidatus Xenobia bacterium]|jgi:hypothetical protein
MKHAVKRVAWILLCLLCLSMHAWASDFVDYTLTCQRVQQQPQTDWDQQMVLWQGVVLAQTPDGKHVELALQVGSQGVVQVRYGAKCPTLQSDRTGYRVAAKGRIHLEKGAFMRLEGVSLILLEPPVGEGFTAYEGRLTPASHDLGDFIGWRFAFHHPEYTDAQVTAWGHQVVKSAQAENLDPLLLAALLQIESAYRIDAVSKDGAIGLGQLMDFTATAVGYDAHDPLQNIAGSAHYLAGLYKRFSTAGDPMRYSLAAYNAGPNAVVRYNGVPPIAETINYVTFVRLVWKELKAETERYGVGG